MAVRLALGRDALLLIIALLTYATALSLQSQSTQRSHETKEGNPRRESAHGIGNRVRSDNTILPRGTSNVRVRHTPGRETSASDSSEEVVRRDAGYMSRVLQLPAASSHTSVQLVHENKTVKKKVDRTEKELRHNADKSKKNNQTREKSKRNNGKQDSEKTKEKSKRNNKDEPVNQTEQVQEPPAPQTPSPDKPKKQKTVYRQQLVNFQDMQYSADMQVGGQTIRGILDTGSFELLVFGTDCVHCGTASKYQPSLSETYTPGPRNRTQSYGSGSCVAIDARDTVGVGPLSAEKQAFWKATTCKMPLLDQADFNAVVGIGPPGQVVHTAMMGLKQAKEMEHMCEKLGQPVPKQVKQLERESLEDMEDAPVKPTMLENFGVDAFSLCLERSPGSPGWLVWNEDQDTTKFPFTNIKVVGEITWGIKLGLMKFEGSGMKPHTLGCEKGCGAIVDSGTSLMAVPSHVYHAAFRTVSGMELDCSDISLFPDLVMSLDDGSALHFPPETYLGKLVGQMPEQVQKFMHLRSLGSSSKPTKCEFLMMDMGGQATQFGPMAILGMPFFRTYYTTFHVGKGPGNRWISIAPAADGCQPSMKTTHLDLERSHVSLRKKSKAPRTIDASRLRVPRYLEAIYGM